MAWLQAEKRYVPWLLQNLSGFIAIVDLSGVIRYVTPSVEGVLGYHPQMLIGRHLSHVVHPDDLIAAAHVLVPQSIGTRWSAEFRARKQDGTWRAFRGTATVHEEMQSLVAIVVCEEPADVTSI